MFVIHKGGTGVRVHIYRVGGFTFLCSLSRTMTQRGVV